MVTHWKLTLQLSTDEDMAGDIAMSGVSSQDDLFGALEEVANSMARLLCATDKLGILVPVGGDKIMKAFDETIEEEWDYWDATQDPTPEPTQPEQ